MKNLTLISAVALFLFSFTPADTGKWSSDAAHSRLGFSVTHLLISEVEGSFGKFDATITATKDDFSDAVVTLTADAGSVDTDNSQRDAHLKNPDFFDAANHPTITFNSTSFTRAGDRNYKVKGNLTMHGFTKAIELDASYNTTIHPMTQKNIAGFRVTGAIKRTDFGIGTSFMSNAISDEVRIVANVQFIKNDVVE